MKLSRKVGSTSQILQIFIQDSSSTTGAGLTGLVFNSSGLTAYYHRDNQTTATAITLVTMTVGTFTSSGFREIDATNMPGWYQFCPPDAAFISGDSVGFHLKGVVNMAPLPIEVDLNSQVNLVEIDGLATSAANATLNLKKLVITNTAGDAVTLTSSGSNGSGLSVVGNGSGHGLRCISGTSGNGIYSFGGAASGAAVRFQANNTNADGLTISGFGTGNGITTTGGATGAGLRAVGGATSGDGIVAIATTSGNGLTATGTGTTKHGISATGGSISSHGISAAGGGTGAGLRTVGGATGIGFNSVGGATSGVGIGVTTTSGDAVSFVSTLGHGLTVTGGTAKHGINAAGRTTGAGILATGGATGFGISAVGGATSGDGISAVATTSGHGFTTTGVGTTKHGINATGGSISSNGISAAGGGTGAGLRTVGGATGSGIDISGGGTSGDGLSINTTNGVGIDILALGGSNAGIGITGALNGIQITGSGNGSGILSTGLGTGAGMTLTAAGTGVGFKINGGASSGDGIGITTTSGHAISAVATGASKHGMLLTGGNSGVCDGLSAIAGTGGVDIRGNLSGSVGSVTARVTANTDQIAGSTIASTNLSNTYAAFETGTAQAGAATTITLRAGAVATNDYYKDQAIFILSGAGAGQTNRISSYVGATKVATVATTWATTPNITSVYLIVGRIG